MSKPDWSEKELEDWLSNPDNLERFLFLTDDGISSWHGCFEMLGRQVSCVTGRIDLLYMFDATRKPGYIAPTKPKLMILELKARELQAGDIAQVLKYRKALFDYCYGNYNDFTEREPLVECLLIGSGLSQQVADAMDAQGISAFIAHKDSGRFLRSGECQDSRYELYATQEVKQAENYIAALDRYYLKIRAKSRAERHHRIAPVPVIGEYHHGLD